MVDSKGTTYLVYSLSSITLAATAKSSTSGEIRASGAFTGVLRLVKLNDPTHKTLLDQHYQVYPKSAGLDYSFTDTSSNVIFNWNTVGDGSQLLMLTWPHHRVSLQSPNYPATTALNYLTTKVRTYFRRISMCMVINMIHLGVDVPNYRQSVDNEVRTFVHHLESAEGTGLVVQVISHSGA